MRIAVGRASTRIACTVHTRAACVGVEDASTCDACAYLDSTIGFDLNSEMLPRVSLLNWLVVVLTALLAMGCGARREYVVQDLTLTRQGWDTLRVDVHFAQQTSLGHPTRVVPEDLDIFVFNSQFDTLAAGHEALLFVPDRELRDRERILVEICGRFGTATVCAQEAMAASPKRFHLDHRLTYPTDDAYERGRYRLAFTLERQQFEADHWEPIERERKMAGFVRAFVGQHPESSVIFPFSRVSGPFDLARLDNFKDFRYFLDLRLKDDEAATVFFEVYTEQDPLGSPHTVVPKLIRIKTPEERIYEVSSYVEQAAEQVVMELKSALGTRDTYAFVNNWQFNTIKKRYEIEMELTWRGGLVGRNWHELTGVLSVREDGGEPSFTRTRSNRRAELRWRRRVEGAVLYLRPLIRPEAITFDAEQTN